MTINYDNILFSVHLSRGMIINYVDAHYANFALIIIINELEGNRNNKRNQRLKSIILYIIQCS